jgi:hypothetical protein
LVHASSVKVVDRDICGHRPLLKYLALILLLIPVAACGPSVSASGQQSMDAAFSACNQPVTPQCNITIPVGTFAFSVQVAPSATFSIQGAGASYDNPGISSSTYIEPHCLTTLVWQGGDHIPFVISSYHLHGSKLAGFCLDAVGTSPEVFIEVDKAAGNVTLDDVVIDTPNTQARVAAIRYGNTGTVIDPICNNVFVRASAPIGFDILDVEAHFVGTHCRAVWNGVNEWVIGGGGHLVESFHCVFCSAEARPTNIPVQINNTIGFWWSEGYLECGPVCFDIPATAVTANTVVITNSFVGGDNTPPLVRTGLASATVSESGNYVRNP